MPYNNFSLQYSNNSLAKKNKEDEAILNEDKPMLAKSDGGDNGATGKTGNEGKPNGGTGGTDGGQGGNGGSSGGGGGDVPQPDNGYNDPFSQSSIKIYSDKQDKLKVSGSMITIAKPGGGSTTYIGTTVTWRF